MSGGGFVTNYVQGGFSKGFQGVGNFFTINGQMFDAGTETKGWGWRLLSRFTWEGLNTGVGNIAATLTNSSGVVPDVQYYRGATVLKTRGDYGAFTLGNNIIGDRNIEAEYDDDNLQHEYGHYIQSRIIGPSYLFKIALPSLISATFNSPSTHEKSWFEQDANAWALSYFKLNEPEFNKDTDWHNPDGKKALGIHRQHWYDYMPLYYTLGDFFFNIQW